MITRSIATMTIALSFLAYSNAGADSMPNIRPGMWESTMEIPEEGGTKPQKMTAKQCFGDKESLTDLFTKAQKSMQGQCGEMKFTSSGSTYMSTVTCDLGISKLTLKTKASGDFKTQYSFESDTSFNPPFLGQTNHHSTGSARYLGPCEPGTKAGDVITEDGKKININDIGKMPKISEAQRKEIANQQAKIGEMLKNIDPKQLEQMQKLMQQGAK